MVIFKPLNFGVVCYAAIANRSKRQGRQVLEKRRCPHKAKGSGGQPNESRVGVCHSKSKEGSKQTTPKQAKGAENSGHVGVWVSLVFKDQLKANWGRAGLKEPFGVIMPLAPPSQVPRKETQMKRTPSLIAHTSMTVPSPSPLSPLLGLPTPLAHTPSIYPTSPRLPKKQLKDIQWHFQ